MFLTNSAEGLKALMEFKLSSTEICFCFIMYAHAIATDLLTPAWQWIKMFWLFFILSSIKLRAESRHDNKSCNSSSSMCICLTSIEDCYGALRSVSLIIN